MDLLTKAPLTTGEISKQIENLSRYAVMKHLGILEKANLIVAKKEGKYRWNYLNTRPIKESYEQWLSHLLDLKRYAETSTISMGPTDKSIMTTTLSLEVRLKASSMRVWKAITSGIDQWWLEEFFTSEEAQRFVLEPKLGGLWYEETGEASGLVWGTVIGLEPTESLLLKGHLTPQLGGPAISFLHFALEGNEKSTTLRFSDTIFGEISSSLNGTLKSNWEKLLLEGLKPYVENQ